MSSAIAKRLLLVVVATTFAVALAELSLRQLWTPPTLRSTRAFGPHDFYRVAPLPCIEGIHATSEYEHAFQHNCQRLRSRTTFARERPAGISARVLVLGDSFAYGLGVGDDETFAARLGSALDGVEVANTGCNGYGTRDELAVLDRFGAAYAPDLTVLVFFWNDLENNLERSAPSFELSSDGRVVRADHVTAAPRDPLAPWPAARAERRSAGPLYLGLLFKEGAKGLRYRWLGISPRFIRSPQQKERAWRITRELLALTQRRAVEIGSSLLVASIPSHNRVDPDAAIKNIEPLHFMIEERLARVTKELGIPYVDLLPALEAAFAGGRDLYYYADRHLTADGHRVVTEALEPAVRRMLSLPPASPD